MSTYQDFTLGEVLFLATGGRICSPLHRQAMEPMLDLVGYMHGCKISVVELTELNEMIVACQSSVLAQHPFLRDLVARIEAGELEVLYGDRLADEQLFQRCLSEWLGAQVSTPGQRFTLKPLSDSQPPPAEAEDRDR